jgi:ABC-type multidrug transport system fused ATPase/permease subunit
MLKKILFSDVSPLIKEGRKKPLWLKDLPELPELWNPEAHLKGFDTMTGDRGGRQFIRDIILVLKPQAKRLGVMILFILIFKMVSPILIHNLIESVGLVSRGEITLFEGILTALLLCLTQLSSAILGQHYVYHAVTSTQSAINGINQRICSAILTSTSAGNKKGQVINRASSDAELAGASLWAICEVVQIAFTMISTIGLLFYYLGTAAIAPLLIMCSLIPMGRFFSKKFSKIQSEIMHHRDERVGRMSQFLDGIKVIKSFVWEKFVHDEISSLRKEETHSWKKLAARKSLSTGSFLLAGLLVSTVAFGVYIAQGKILSAATAFTCLTLFSYLEPCFKQLPKILGELSSSIVAGERISALLKDSHTQAPTKTSDDISLTGVSINYPGKENVLQNVNLSIKKGESIALIGPVGSGKSTLLKTLLGELHPHEGSASLPVNLKKAYVPQDPFLFHSSLEENITFGHLPSDQNALTEALHASCLEHDIEFMPNGLSTEIGEGGGNLSGGQKQRVNLARAALHASEFILMDDPLSALDPVTEKQIIDRLIFGLWKDETRIVSTHRLEYLKKFDRILYLDNGSIVYSGSFTELYSQNEHFRHFIHDHHKEEKKETKSEIVDVQKKLPSMDPVPGSVEKESIASGEVSLKLYWNYFKAMAKYSRSQLPYTLGLLVLTSVSAMAVPIFQNRWLSRWTQSLSSGSDQSYLLIYAALGVLSVLVCAFQHLYWARKAVDAAETFHEGALEGVLSSVIRYFDANPSGRILNRFSRDLDALEKDLSWSLEEAFMALLNSIGAIIVMLTALPFMGIVVLPVIFIYWYLQKSYRTCMREVKRLMAVARSPRISSIKEVLDGAPVIRCFEAEAFFKKRFTHALSDYQKAFFGVVLINRWFSIRIPVVSSLLSLAAAIGVIVLGSTGHVTEGLAGMSLVYAFRFWDGLNWTVRAFGEAEAQMTSVERLDSLASLPSEAQTPGSQDLKEFKGAITFNNVFARYAPHLPDVLKGTSFSIKAGSKVGVIGRTGAGKSTLFGLLHRFMETSEGSIELDGMNINDFPLAMVREVISTIPQNPILFAGTIRDNLDPLKKSSDEDLLKFLNQAHVLPFLSNGLNTEVKEGGHNFSRGQRQLVCLARALARSAQVIIVDEASASVDGKTDALIRDILMHECEGITVLIIAHKHQSVSLCDMILEMRDGRVLETTYPSLEILSA